MPKELQRFQHHMTNTRNFSFLDFIKSRLISSFFPRHVVVVFCFCFFGFFKNQIERMSWEPETTMALHSPGSLSSCLTSAALSTLLNISNWPSLLHQARMLTLNSACMFSNSFLNDNHTRVRSREVTESDKRLTNKRACSGESLSPALHIW